MAVPATCRRLAPGAAKSGIPGHQRLIIQRCAELEKLRQRDTDKRIDTHDPEQMGSGPIGVCHGVMVGQQRGHWQGVEGDYGRCRPAYAARMTGGVCRHRELPRVAFETAF